MEQLNSSRLRAACICALILLLSTSLSAKTIYVKWDSPGPTFDGVSWDTAYHKVSEGLSASVSDDEVWVARGTYVECITLTAGVGLYGGFAGTETLRAERDWKANVTILDGNRQGSVVTSPEGADNSTVIDGFTIRNGKGSLSVGGGIMCPASSPTISDNVLTNNTGGAIHCRYSSPLIVHNAILMNSGGGIVSRLGSGGVIARNTIRLNTGGSGISCTSSSPLIMDNAIEENTGFPGVGIGGGILCGGDCSPVITGNRIVANRAEYGAGIRCYLWSSPRIYHNVIASNIGTFGAGISSNTSSPIIYNNRIVANTAEGARPYGGGMSCYGGSPMILNNTFVGNKVVGSQSADGGAIDSRISSATIANNIITLNSSGICARGTLPAPVVRNNCVYRNDLYDYDGVPVGDGDIVADPGLASIEFGNFHIQPDSPCVDAGDDSVVQQDWTDVDGEPRILGAHVDIGADESDGRRFPEGPYVMVRVSSDGNDDNDGSTWALAKRSVQAGIDAASAGGGDVWVRSGTYPERVNLQCFAYVYGGFSGVETSRQERDWIANSSVLDGQQSGRVVTALSVSSWSAIDGLVIRNGWGSGVYCYYSSPDIRNNVIEANGHRWAFGGGIYCDRSSPNISRNMITGNLAQTGGGIYCSSSAPRISNNVITDNLCVGGQGAGISCAGSTPVIAGNTIAKNGAGRYDHGDGISCYSSAARMVGNVVVFNTCGIRIWGTPPILEYNDVWGNRTFNYSGFTADPVPDPTGTNGNISEDPLFRDFAGGDYRLRPESPCVDTGTNEGAPPTDILGFPRPIDGNCDGIAVTDMGAYEYQPIRVLVDILPGDPSNTIRLRANRQIPVAVLSTPTFDAREIDPTSVVFGPGRATEVHGRGHWEDVNRDGRIDLLLHFSCAATGLTPGMETATLYGRLTNGEWITGSDRV